MSHEKDREHPPEHEPPKQSRPLVSRTKPDRKYCEHPSSVPREPVDPKAHPSRV